MMLPDDTATHAHLMFAFEPQSRTYEITVNGESGATVDGYTYASGAVVRVVSGSCVKLGSAGFCVLLPQPSSGVPRPKPLPVPSLPGAGGTEPPPLPLLEIALLALREARGFALSLGEVEQYVRRVYPRGEYGAGDGQRQASNGAPHSSPSKQRPGCELRVAVGGDVGRSLLQRLSRRCGRRRR